MRPSVFPSILLCGTFVIFGAQPSFSQGNESDDLLEFHHGQVLTATGVSSLPFLSYSLARGMESFAQEPPFSNSAVGEDSLIALLPVLEPLPIATIDPGRAGLWVLGGVATYSTAQASVALGFPESLRHTLFLTSWKYGMYTTYETYKEFRSRSSDESYRNFRRYSFQEVTFAPFTLESYNNPVSMITLPLFIVGEAVSRYITSGSSHSVFATGKTYIDQTEFNPLLGVTLATGEAALVAVQNSYEEAYWRGYVYEEIKYNFKGDWVWANLATNALFALWHIPNQGLNWSTLGVFASGALCTWAYELGGVPAAGAAHGLVNASSDLVGFFLYGGAERKRSSAAVENSVSSDKVALSFGAPLKIGLSY